MKYFTPLRKFSFSITGTVGGWDVRIVIASLAQNEKVLFYGSPMGWKWKRGDVTNAFPFDQNMQLLFVQVQLASRECSWNSLKIKAFLSTRTPSPPHTEKIRRVFTFHLHTPPREAGWRKIDCKIVFCFIPENIKVDKFPPLIVNSATWVHTSK